MRGEEELPPAVAADGSRSQVRGPAGTRRGDLEFETIGRLVRIAADRHPDVAALVDGPTRLTFGELADAVDGSCRAAMAPAMDRAWTMSLASSRASRSVSRPIPVPTWITCANSVGPRRTVIVTLRSPHADRSSTGDVMPLVSFAL